MPPCSGWSARASEEGVALLGVKMSDRSCAVFFCSGRSAGTSFGVWASAMASRGRSGGWVFGSSPDAEPHQEYVSTRQQDQNEYRERTTSIRHRTASVG